MLVLARGRTPCVLGEGRVRKELRSDWIQLPVRQTFRPEERFTGEGTVQSNPVTTNRNGETEGTGVIWREKTK